MKYIGPRILKNSKGQTLRFFCTQILGGIAGETTSKGHEAVNCKSIHFDGGRVAGYGGGSVAVDDFLDKEISYGEGALLQDAGHRDGGDLRKEGRNKERRSA